jgi:MazG family protein
MTTVPGTDRRWDKMRNIWNLIDRLRGTGGCPWDRKQTPESVQTYLVEEAHEAAAAVRANQEQEVAEELGDLLFMALFLVHLYEEKGVFRLDEVCDRVCEKMRRRHPHVFGDLAVRTSQEVVDNWEKIKADEKAASGKVALGIPESLPALMRGYRLLARLASDQPQLNDLNAQIEDYSCKHVGLQQRLSDGEAVPAEAFGELLLRLVNLARLKGCHAETCLHEALGRLEAANK